MLQPCLLSLREVSQQGPVKVAGDDSDSVKFGMNAIRSKYPAQGQPLQAMAQVEQARCAETMLV